MIRNVLKKKFKENIIEYKQKISETVYKIQIKGESIKNADFVAGYFLRVAIGMSEGGLSMKDFVRSYSVWNIDKTKGTIDLAVATHSNGAGAKWAENCKVGDKVYFTWKTGNFIVDNTADSYLFIGDLSALSHLYVIRRSLENNKKVESIIYTQHQNEFYADIDGTMLFNAYVLPKNPYIEIIDKIKEIAPKMTG